MPYARGRKALGICDNCGEQWKRHQLRNQVIAGRVTNLLHCPDCLDVDNPQLLLGKIKVFDPWAIHQPRPDPALAQLRSLYGWNPVSGCVATCYPQLRSGVGLELNFPYVQ